MSDLMSSEWQPGQGLGKFLMERGMGRLLPMAGFLGVARPMAPTQGMTPLDMAMAKRLMRTPESAPVNNTYPQANPNWSASSEGVASNAGVVPAVRPDIERNMVGLPFPRKGFGLPPEKAPPAVNETPAIGAADRQYLDALIKQRARSNMGLID